MMEKVGDFIIKLLMYIVNKLAHKRNLQSIQSIVDIYSNMKDVVSANGGIGPVYNFVVMKAENGGKRIKPGSQLYLSTLYEDYKPPVNSFLCYQRVHIDGAFMETLLQCMQKQQLPLDFKTMDDCLIKRICEVDKITYAEIHYLYDKAECVYFCMVTTTQINERFRSGKDRLAIDLAVGNIKAKIKKAV